jgi:TM2 domain-containing membrane protein YozV
MSPLNVRGLLRRWEMKLFEFQKTDKNPGTAAILSFLLIGLGQAYNGEIAKAVAFLILYAISIFLTFFMIGFLTTPILWIWSMTDAYRSSQKMNQVGTSSQSPSNASPPGLVMNAQVMD